jgi:hypothetical protein
MDFTLKTYHQLLNSLQKTGYSFQTFNKYLDNQFQNIELQTSNIKQKTSNNKHQTIIFRQDVDKSPHKALKFAQIQHSMGVKGSYYFRAVTKSWNEEVIKEIANLGHEIGYHYENMYAVIHQKSEGKTKAKCRKFAGESPDEFRSKHIDVAYQDFVSNLEKFRQIADIKTISMHGSYNSKYDNKAIWEKYDYKKLGILGEPYLDLDFNEFFYLTDTGRRWNGWDYSIWDKVPQQEEWIKQGLVFKTTQDIINAAKQGKLPHKIMFTFHPQRWTDNPFLWTKELVLQNVKNQLKRFLVKK